MSRKRDSVRSRGWGRPLKENKEEKNPCLFHHGLPFAVRKGPPQPFHRAESEIFQPPDRKGYLKGIDNETNQQVLQRAGFAHQFKPVIVKNQTHGDILEYVIAESGPANRFDGFHEPSKKRFTLAVKQQETRNITGTQGREAEPTHARDNELQPSGRFTAPYPDIGEDTG